MVMLPGALIGRLAHALAPSADHPCLRVPQRPVVHRSCHLETIPSRSGLNRYLASTTYLGSLFQCIYGTSEDDMRLLPSSYIATCPFLLVQYASGVFPAVCNCCKGLLSISRVTQQPKSMASPNLSPSFTLEARSHLYGTDINSHHMGELDPISPLSVATPRFVLIAGM